VEEQLRHEVSMSVKLEN
jgi:hypothetical protein